MQYHCFGMMYMYVSLFVPTNHLRSLLSVFVPENGLPMRSFNNATERSMAFYPCKHLLVAATGVSG